MALVLGVGRGAMEVKIHGKAPDLGLSKGGHSGIVSIFYGVLNAPSVG